MYSNFYAQFLAAWAGVDASLSSLSTSLAAPFAALLTLAVIIWGYAMMTGRVRELLSDSTARIFRWTIVGVLATNFGFYTTNVASFFSTSVPCWAVSALVSGAGTCASSSSGNAGSFLVEAADGLLTQGIAAALKAGQGFDFTSSRTYLGLLLGFIILIGTVLASLFVFFEIVIVFAILQILLALGPVFIALAVFDRTSHFFTSWINRVARSMVEVLLLSVAFAANKAIVAVAATSTNTFAQSLGAALAVFIGLGLFLLVPSLSSALTGGHGGLSFGAIMAGPAGRGVTAAAGFAAGGFARAGAGTARGLAGGRG